MADDQPEIWVDESEQAGVWANWARVFESPEEFVLDLACTNPEDESKAVLVARVRCAPRFAADLADHLADAWRRYARAALPKEVNDGEEETGSGPEVDQGPGGE